MNLEVSGCRAVSITIRLSFIEMGKLTPGKGRICCWELAAVLGLKSRPFSNPGPSLTLALDEVLGSGESPPQSSSGTG